MNYIHSFTLELKIENLEDPSVIRLLDALSNSNNQMTRGVRELAQNWNTVAKFIRQPSLNRDVLVSLAQAIVYIEFRQRTKLLKKLAPTFTPLIANDFDLQDLLNTLGTIIVDSEELFELLLTMSSIVGQTYRTQRLEALLTPYLRIAFESRPSDPQADIASQGDPNPPEQAIYRSILRPNAFPLDSLGFGIYTFPTGRRRESMSFLDPLEGTETKEFNDLFLRTLLWYANSTTYELLNTAIQNWPDDIKAKWHAYTPQGRKAATTRTPRLSLIGRLIGYPLKHSSSATCRRSNGAVHLGRR